MSTRNDELPIWALRLRIEREIAQLRPEYAALMPAPPDRPSWASPLPVAAGRKPARAAPLPPVRAPQAERLAAPLP